MQHKYSSKTKPTHSTYYYSQPNQSHAYFSSLSATGNNGVHRQSPTSAHRTKNGSSSFLPRISGASAFSNYSADGGYMPVANIKVSHGRTSRVSGSVLVLESLFQQESGYLLSCRLLSSLQKMTLFHANIDVCIKRCTLTFDGISSFFYCSHALLTAFHLSFNHQPFRSKTSQTSKNRCARIYCQKETSIERGGFTVRLTFA